MSRIQRIPIDGGFTCPNRDGTKGWGGCTFCHPEAFAPSYCRAQATITQQVEAGKRFFASKHRGETAYWVYFQSYSGTYADIDTLRARYTEALSVEGVTGIVIGTRPDCISAEVLDLLCELKEKYAVQIEYGVESCYDRTLLRVNRGHTFECVRQAICRTAERGISVGVHLIIGLPGETRADILHEAEILSALPIDTLKLHQLQIMRGTPMAEEWSRHPADFLHLSVVEYADLVAGFLHRLRSDITIERFAAGAPSALLLHPRWGLKPQQVQQLIEERIRLQ